MKDLPPQPPPLPPSSGVASAVAGAGAAPAARRAERPYEPAFGNLPLYLLGRLCAALVDTFAIGFVFATFAFKVAAGNGGALTWVLVPLAAQSEGTFAALSGLSIGCALLLAFLTEALVGTTIGKLLFALNVRTVRGGWAGFGRVFVRNIMRPIDLLLIGPLLAAVTPKHQRARRSSRRDGRRAERHRPVRADARDRRPQRDRLRSGALRRRAHLGARRRRPSLRLRAVARRPRRQRRPRRSRGSSPRPPPRARSRRRRSRRPAAGLGRSGGERGSGRGRSARRGAGAAPDSRRLPPRVPPGNPNPPRAHRF